MLEARNPCRFQLYIYIARSHLLQSNALNLDGHTLRQLRNRHTAARRLMGEEFLIGSIHLREVGHIRQEDLQYRQPSPTSVYCDIISRKPRESCPGKNEWERRTYVHLNDLLHAGPGRVEDGLDVVAASLGLDADAALDELRGRVCGDLAGDEDLAVCAHGLGLDWDVNGVLWLLCCIVGR